MTPPSDNAPRATLRRDASRIGQLLRPEAGNYTLGLSSLLVVNASDVISPVFLAVAVDLTVHALGGAEPTTPAILRWVGLDATTFTVLGAILLYLALHLLSNVSRYPMLMYTAVPSHAIGQTLRRSLTAHFLRLSQPFYDRSKAGDLMSHATNDIQAVRMMLGPGVLVGSDTLMIVTLVTGVLLSLSWQLTLIAFLPLPIIAWVTNRLSHAEYERFETVQADLATLTERSRESYAGIRILQGYAREAYDRERFGRYSERHRQKNLALAKVNALFMPTLDVMVGASTVLVLIFGGLQLVDGTMSVGTFVAFLFLIGYLSGPMIGFGWAVSLFQRGRASLRRLDALLAEPVEIVDQPGALTASGPGSLSVRSLTFRYASAPPTEAASEGMATARRPALADVSLEVPAGSTLGIIGPVGSGKSTLARLLVRLYEPPAGAVRLDDVDIRDLTLASLRSAIVLAPQDTFLFSDTVARNIAVAGDQSQETVEAFARRAHLHDELLQLADGYETMLGERGVNLSGGQRQRLAIARTLATDPRVIVLDDCLSAVDARTEEAILGSLRQAFEGRTGIVISHRVCAVQHSDQIIVLEEGRIVERGTHVSLLAAGGYYARVAEEQGREDAGASAQVAQEERR